MSILNRHILTLEIIALTTLRIPVSGQTTATDYTRADQFLSWNAALLVEGDEMSPEWLDEDRFWYLSHIGDGHEFILVDPNSRTRGVAFDHNRLAAALSIAADTSYVANKLPFETFDFVEDQSIQFHTGDSIRWECSLASYTCAGPDPIPDRPDTERLSPDGRWVAFTRDENLWIRSVDDDEEIRLSDDGEENFGYAVPPEGCCSAITLKREGNEAPPVLTWSPDSRRIATHRLDERDVKQLHLLEAKTGRPELHSYRVALPGDSVIPTYEIHIFDIDNSAATQVRMDPLEAMNTSCCGLMIDTLWKDVRWGNDSEQVFFTRSVRSYDTLQLYAADTDNGEARLIVEEHSKTFVEANGRSGGIPNWRVINRNSEVVWWSERDGWGHLYLFDAVTGELKNRITEGPWMVLDLLHVDDTGRWAYFTGVGREEGRDIYNRHLYRAALDGGRVELLSPEDADHEIWVSPSGRYFIDQFGDFESAPTTVLRNSSGGILLGLQEGDFSELLATGWNFPTHFVATGRDGVTPVHGLLFFPSNFDPNTKYPVVDYIYPGPQVGAVRGRQASVRQGGNAAALAELGFIVFLIDAMGTPARDKAFHDSYYGNMRDNGLPDHIAALRQLARRYPQIDLDHVGIFGHSGGGFSSTDAILSYPDFFKVAVSSAGNHDNRSYDYTWGEKYHGLLENNDDGTNSFDSQANQNLAGELSGKLLLIYGTLDDNVHPNATIMLIDELIEHNKDFDLLVMPNRNHGFANEPYVIRRTWDYFVMHLQGRTTPNQFRIIQPGD